MSLLRTVAASIALGAALLGASACSSSEGSAAPSKLKMGLPPGEAAPDLQQQFKPVSDTIAAGAGRPVTVTTTSDYLAIVEAMRSGLLDVAVFSPFPTPLAEKVAHVKPLVVAKGAPYSSVFVCSADSGVQKITDIRGKSVAFVDPGSTSGNYIPKLMLKRAGIDPEKDIHGTYAGGHDTAELAVKQGSVDCAADAHTVYDQMVAKKVISPSHQKIVAESDPIPVSLVIIARDGLDSEITDGITEAFTKHPEAGALKTVGATSFAKAKESDFEIFRDAAKELGVNLKNLNAK